MISRRNFLKSTATGLAAVILSPDYSAQAQQSGQNDYRITYEEWKEAVDIYGKTKLAPVDKKRILIEELKKTKLVEKVSNISNNPRSGYHSLTQEERNEELRVYKEHQSRTDFRDNPMRVNPNARPMENLADQLVGQIFLPLTLPLAVLDNPKYEKEYFKEVYGADVAVEKGNLGIKDRLLIYWEHKHKQTYEQEKEKEAKAKKEAREKEEEKRKNEPKTEKKESTGDIILREILNVILSTKK